MKSDIRVATPPPKPLLVFDGDCNFCTLWIRRWQQITGDAVDYLPSQDANVAIQFPEISRERFQTSVQLIETDGAVYSGAEAVFRLLAKNPKRQWPLRAYESSPASANITEWAYRFVARHRIFFSRLTRWFLGQACRTTGLFSHALDFSARARRDLSHCLCFALDANRRTHRPQWNFANRPIHVRRPTTMRRARHRP